MAATGPLQRGLRRKRGRLVGGWRWGWHGAGLPRLVWPCQDGAGETWAPPPALQTCQRWDEAVVALRRDAWGPGRQLEAVRSREE